MTSEDRPGPDGLEQTDGGEGNADRTGIAAQCVGLLIANGYVIETVRERLTSTEIECQRLDEFGSVVNYLIALTHGETDPGSARTLQNAAAQRSANLVVLTAEPVSGVISVSWPSFVARLGGPIDSDLPLRSDFGESLELLGRNSSVVGLEGNPSTLYETYVHHGLSFLVANRLIRYGQDRRFEAVPDGFGYLGAGVTYLYDAKASATGYEVDRDSLRQFCDYIEVYRRRYSAWVGQPFVFLVVSSAFANGKESRAERSAELFAQCGVPLTFMASSELAACVATIAPTPWARSSVDWRRVLAPVDVVESRLAAELRAIARDEVHE